MKKTIRILFAVIAVAAVLFAAALPAFADEAVQAPAGAVQSAEESKPDSEGKIKISKAYAAGIAIAVVAAAGAIGMAVSISKSSDAIARQPEAAGNIRTSLMLGLVFIETTIIYALIVAILIVFVL